MASMNARDVAGDFLGALSQTNRPIRLRLSDDSNAFNDELLIKRVVGTETMCGGFEYRLHCVSNEVRLQLKKFIAIPVELQIVTDRGDFVLCAALSAR
jgi:type VI secretion system secreted protein VgrG